MITVCVASLLNYFQIVEMAEELRRKHGKLGTECQFGLLGLYAKCTGFATMPNGRPRCVSADLLRKSGLANVEAAENRAICNSCYAFVRRTGYFVSLNII